MLKAMSMVRRKALRGDSKSQWRMNGECSLQTELSLPLDTGARFENPPSTFLNYFPPPPTCRVSNNKTQPRNHYL
ncbi:hypothetical protein RJT34_25677 [Clitoria ternatea]|uniref:Uncharacterized protein n=1 Tax=Clitoria ternatea TaxID=43366 RepID=A0AAN9IIR1_CLITE